MVAPGEPAEFGQEIIQRRYRLATALTDFSGRNILEFGCGSSAEGVEHIEIDKLIHEPARMMLMAHLYVVTEADFVFLIHHTGLTWGNLSAHLTKLENAGYVALEKSFVGKKPRTKLRLTARGRSAFKLYRERLQQILSDIPD